MQADRFRAVTWQIGRYADASRGAKQVKPPALAVINTWLLTWPFGCLLMTIYGRIATSAYGCAFLASANAGDIITTYDKHRIVGVEGGKE